MLLIQKSIFADYHQFYLADDAAEPDAAALVTPEALAARLLAWPSGLAMFTARNMEVEVSVHLHGTRPALDLGGADHAVEAGFSAPSGRLAVAGCTDYWPDAARVDVPAGPMSALVVFSGLGTVSADGLDGDDCYAVHLWPGAAQGVRVVKAFDAPA